MKTLDLDVRTYPAVAWIRTTAAGTSSSAVKDMAGFPKGVHSCTLKDEEKMLKLADS
jgi:hypothetical protein